MCDYLNETAFFARNSAGMRPRPTRYRRVGVTHCWTVAGAHSSRVHTERQVKRQVPRFVEPMAATLVSALPAGVGWLYEAKFDGYRAVALKNGASVKILSRRGNDLTRSHPDSSESRVRQLIKTSAYILVAEAD